LELALYWGDLIRSAGIVDATYEPVIADGVDRDAAIVRDYGLLVEDLAALLPDRSTPVALVKANVCRRLDQRLVQDGFNVINRGRVAPFPSTVNQKKFQIQFGEVLRSAS
jgi:hypothetical protein